MHLVLCLVGLPLLPLDLGPARGVGVPLGIRLAWAGSLPLFLLLREEEERELPALDRCPFPRVSESVDSPQFSPHVPRRENSRESSASCSRALSSRDSRSSGREPRKDKRARSREGSSRGRRRRSRSRSSSRSRSRGRERGRRSSSASRSSRGRSRRERSRSSDRYRSRRGSSRSRRERARSPARRGERRDRSRSHAPPNRSLDRLWSSERLSASSARLRADEAGRLARRGTQEGAEAVASQPPVAPGGAADVTPVAGGASMTALPSAMRELARFFMNLSGPSSLGATGDIAGVTASAVASGGLACPSSTAAGAATFCAAAATPAGAGVSPDAPAAVPGVSGEQQRRVRSRSRGRRSRSSSERTDRRAKKCTRRRSPSGRSSRRREKRYRSSSDSSEDDRADASPLQARRAHGGARAGGSAWDFDRPRSSARVESDRSGARRRSPGPSGVAEDDRSSTFESVDFAQDDSFRAVLGLIREFHDMAESATVPAARCKTSLASAYGLASDSSPAFTLPVSPLLSTLLLDINSDLSSFWRTRPCTGSCPCPVAGSGGTTAPPPLLFLGRTQSHLV